MNAVHLHIFWQTYWQLCQWHGNLGAIFQIAHRNRCTPITLARNTPVPQTVIHLLFALAFVDQHIGNSGESAIKIEAIKLTGVDQNTLLGKGGLAQIAIFITRRLDDLFDRQTINFGEFIITLIVSWHRHNRTGTKIHQHKVGGPNRDVFAGNGVGCLQAGINTFLFHCGHISLVGGVGFALFNKGCQRWVVCRRCFAQWMFGRNGHIGNAHQGIGASGVHSQIFAGTVDLEGHLHTFGAANPVALHGFNLLRPFIQLVQVFQQFVSIGGNFDKPLGQLFALNWGIAAPASAIFHLLIGEHGLVVRAPVHCTHLFVDETFFVQFGEKPLLPLVIFGRTGGHFPVPVVTEAQLLELCLHVIDIFVSPLGRGCFVLDRCVFGRQTKSVPTHRLHNIFTLHAMVAGDYIANGVVTHMPHMQLAAGVGEHGEAVELLFSLLLGDCKTVVLFPVFLGLFLNFMRMIMLFHHCFGCLGAQRMRGPEWVASRTG